MNNNPLPPGASYLDPTQLPAMLSLVEGNYSTAYADEKGIATIGIGLNITLPENMAWFLSQVSIGGVGLFAQAASGASALGSRTPAQVISDFEAIVAAHPLDPYVGPYRPGTTPKEIALQGALDAEIRAYFGLSPTAPIPGVSFENFSASAATLLLEQMIGATPLQISVSGPGGSTFTYPTLYTYAQKLTDWLSGSGAITGTTNPWGISVGANIPPQNTGQWEALLSLFYNSSKLVGKGVLNALKNGDVAQAWYQIRAVHGPGSVWRKFYEAQMFGLSEPGDGFVQAIQSLQSLTEHRRNLITYEIAHGANPDGSAPSANGDNSAGNDIQKANNNISVSQSPKAWNRLTIQTPIYPVQTLSQSYAPEASLIADYLSAQLPGVLPSIAIDQNGGADTVVFPFFVRPTDIFVAPSSADIAAGFASASQLNVRVGTQEGTVANNTAEAARNHILIGSDGPATLRGGTGNDILIAGGGNELLVAGNGSATLVGGQALPASMVGAAGNDTLEAHGGLQPGNDSFVFVVPAGAPVKETILANPLATVGSIEILASSSLATLGGTLAAQLKPVEGQNKVWSADGTAAGEQYTYHADTHVLDISGGRLGSNIIEIENFNITAAESASGFLGLYLTKQLHDTSGANAGVDPPAPDFMSGTLQSYTVYLDAAVATTTPITITLSGVPASAFQAVVAGSVVPINSDGTFSFAIPAGQSAATFSLVNVAPLATDGSMQWTATMSNPAQAGAIVSGETVSQRYLLTPASTIVASTSISGNLVSGITYWTDNGQNDVIVGAATPNSFSLYSGSDAVSGGSSADTLYGYLGADTVAGGGGNDILVGGFGNGNQLFEQTATSLAAAIATGNSATASGQHTFMSVEDGNNTLIGATGSDLFMVGNGNDVIVMGAGNSVFLGGVTVQDQYLAGFVIGVNASWSITPGGVGGVAVNNVNYMGEGFVAVNGQPYNGVWNNVNLNAPSGLGNDTIFAGKGNDYLLLSNGNNYVELGSGNDTVFAGMGNNTIVAGTGNNWIRGGGGNLFVSMVSGNQTIYGGVGNNTVFGGAGNDLISTKPGSISSQPDGSVYTADNFPGQTAAVNYVYGGSGNDTIYGSAGTDTLIAGTGNSTIYGGSGFEYIVGGSGNDVLSAGSGNDTLMAGGSGRDILYANHGIVTMYGGSGTDLIYGGDGASNVIYAGDGGVAGAVTTVVAGSAATTLYGGAGIDQLWGGSGTNVVYAGDGGVPGAITTVTAGSGNTTIYGGNGTQALYGGTGTDVIYAGDGGTSSAPTSVVAGTGVATLIGGSGVSILQDAVSGHDLIIGGTTNDTLIGIGSDTLFAGVGDDKLQSNGGSVTVSFGGEFGNDTIIAAPFTANLAFGSGVGAGDFFSGAAITSSGQTELTVSGGAGSIAMTGGLTGSLGTVSFADTGAVSAKSFVTTSGSDQTVAGSFGNLVLSIDSSAAVAAGFGRDTISSWGDHATLSAGSGDYQTLFAAGDYASVKGGSHTSAIATGSADTISAATGLYLFATVSGANSVVVGANLAATMEADGTNDTLIAGTGGATFYVHDASTVIQAATQSVANAIRSTVSYTLPTNVDFMSLDGTANLVAIGNSDSHQIYGNLGSDTLIAGSGLATLGGGGGTNLFVVNNSADQVTDDTFGVNDTVQSSVSYVLPSAQAISTLVLTGSANLIATGNVYGDTIVSNSGVDTLIAGANGGLFIINNAADVIQDPFNSGKVSVQSSVAYVLPTSINAVTLIGSGNISATANSNADVIVGNAGSDTIYGGTGLDTLIAGAGLATLVGGGGNTSFVVNSSSDVVQESHTALADTILSSATFTLPTNVSALVLTGAAAISGTGNGANHTITAGSGSDTLIAGTGLATLKGGAGNDTFVVNNIADVVQDTITTTNNVVMSSVNYTAPTNVNTLVLTGSANLVATANAANDTLVSNTGVDTLVGGSGNETFVINNTSDVVQDSSTTAVNIAQASVSYTLPTNVNTLILTGSGAIVGTGNSGADSLLGNAGASTLVAGSGNSTLNAGTGPTTMVGGAGRDVFLVNSATDVVVDAFANAGNVIYSSVSYTAPTNVNQLALLGSANLTATANNGDDVLSSNSGIDTLIGGTGNDTFYIRNSADVILDNSATSNNVVATYVNYTAPTNVNRLILVGGANIVGTGNSANDTLQGGAGADTLVAGSGVATMIGGTGDTTFVVNNVNDVVSSSSGTANNGVQSSVSYTLPTNVNTLVLTGSSNLTGTANSGRDTLVSNAGLDTLVGGSGIDTFIVNNSADVVQATSANNIVMSSVTFVAPTNVSTLVLTGSGNLTATANNGNDTLVSNTGVDTLVGGTGNDTFVVNNALDIVQDTSSTSQNVLQTSVSYTLPTNVNTLILAGSANISGTGNSSADSLIAGAGNDTLIAGAGIATLIGGTGNDTFVVNNAADVVQDSSTTAANTLMTSVTYIAPTNVNTVVATGSAGIMLTANSGNDTLISNSGIDTLVGGGGTDTFVVNNSGDVVQANSASNVILSSVSFAAPANVNTIVLTGGGNLSATANAGNDTLVSNSGIDTLIGGTGNDTFVVNNSADVVQDSSTTASNVIQASVSYILPTNVNQLVLTGAANLTATSNNAVDTLVGNAGNDLFVVNNSADVIVPGANGWNSTIQASVSFVAPTGINTLILAGANALTATANSGDDTLVSNSGVDTLIGGTGNDTFVVNNASDVVTGASATSNNVIQSTVSYTLPTNVNTLVLAGAGNLTATGNAANDLIVANAGNTTLVSGAGVDTLVGGSGNDVFVVNNALDVVAMTSGTASATIQSSVSFGLADGIDTLILTGSGSLLGTGNLDASNVLTANSGNDTLIGYAAANTINGGLGVESIVGGAGTNLLYAGNGGVSGNRTTVLGAGASTIYGGSGSDILYGGSGTDLIYLGSGSNTAIAGIGVDTLIGGGTGQLLEDTAGGHDRLVAGAGTEQLYGVGADTLVAGSGTDLLATFGNGAQPIVCEFDTGFGQAQVSGSGVNLYFGAGIAQGSVVVGMDSSGNMILTAGAGSVTVAGGYQPGVVNSITFSGSASQTLSQFLLANAPGVLTSGNYVLVTGNGLSASAGNIGTAYAYGNNDTISGYLAYAYGSSDVVTETTTIVGGSPGAYAGGSGDLVTLTANGIVTISGANDTVVAGKGTETYYVNQSSAVIQVAPGSGQEIIWSTVNYALPNNAQTLNTSTSGVVLSSNSLGGTLNANGTGETLIGGAGADLLRSSGSGNVLVAGSGKESLQAIAPNVTLIGGTGADAFTLYDASDVVQFSATPNAAQSTITAGFSYALPSAANTLVVNGGVGTANGANDTLAAGASFTPVTLIGGAGNDTFIVNNTGDVIQDTVTGTNNVLNSSVSYTLPVNVNTLVLTSSGLVGTANSANDLLIDNSGNNTLVAGSGADTLTAGPNGPDTLVAGTGNDVLQGRSAGGDTFLFNAGFQQDQIQNAQNGDIIQFGAGIAQANLTFTATPGSGGSAPGLVISGAGGAVTVAGGLVPGAISSVNFTSGSVPLSQLVAPTGHQTIAGSGGNLILSATNGDSVIGGTGNDTIVAWGNSDTLTAGAGGSLIYAGGTSDKVTGGAGTDTLVAIGNTTTLVGGSGNEILVVNNTSAVVSVSAGVGHDTVLSSVSYAVPTNVQVMTMIGTANVAATGNALADTITGNAGKDTITAGTGLATMISGTGNTLFVVNNVGDVIQNAYTTNVDSIQSSVSYTLPANVNTITLTGTAALSVTGNAGADLIKCNTGSDTITAGAGPVTIVSGSGSNLFVLNNASDIVLNTPTSGGSYTDTIRSSANVTLVAPVADVVLTGTADLLVSDPGVGTGLIKLFANSGHDTLIAYGGGDELHDGAGGDTMIGGANVSYYVSNASDVIQQLTPSSSTVYSTVSYVLPHNVALLQLQAAGIVGTGNSDAANYLSGGTGDTLVAGSGADKLVSASVMVLNSGYGNDELVGSGTTVDFGAGIAPAALTASVGFDVNGQGALFVSNGTGTATLDGALAGSTYQFEFGAGPVISLGQFLSQVNVATSSVAGGSGNLILEGTPGVSLVGGTGGDSIYAGAANDTIRAGTGSQILYALGTADSIIGAGGADTLVGLGINDTLVAGSAINTLVGGTGSNVTFVVNNASDVISLQASPGVDTVVSSVTYTLPTNVNTLVLSGTGALKGTANNGADTLVSNTGIDTLVAGTGNDLFVVNNASDKVTVGATHGNDTVQSSVSFTAPTNVANLTLTGTGNLAATGNTIANVLTANSGNSTLTAGTGIATMIGGSGNDVFVVNNASDVVQSAYTTNSDTVRSSVTYTLPTNVNTLVLTGTTALKGTANSGNDTLVSNTGVDTLVGGAGNVLFVVSNASDVIQNASTTNSDTISSSVTFTLPTNVNTLVMTGTTALKGTANNGADTLVSNTGVDTLVAGTGNDLFVVNNASDVVTVGATHGNDTVQSSVNYTLPTNVQYLVLTGSANLTGTGNSLTNLIVGNTGNDTLTGGTGVAVLEGGKTGGQDLIRASGNQAALIAGAGASTLTGGAFKDFFAAGLVSDSITTGATANVIAINKGDGATTIQPTTGATNVLSLGGGIDTESLFFTKTGNNLILTDAFSGDSITFANWYASVNNQNVTTLQVIEIASASYNALGADALRNKPQEEFNFTSLVSQFNAAGSPANWALSAGMPTATIASSATAAYGGDLAYYLGLNNNLTGMNLAAAQSTLTNASFATGLQTIDAWGTISGGALPLAFAPISPVSPIGTQASSAAPGAASNGVALTGAASEPALLPRVGFARSRLGNGLSSAGLMGIPLPLPAGLVVTVGDNSGAGFGDIAVSADAAASMPTAPAVSANTSKLGAPESGTSLLGIDDEPAYLVSREGRIGFLRGGSIVSPRTSVPPLSVRTLKSESGLLASLDRVPDVGQIAAVMSGMSTAEAAVTAGTRSEGAFKMALTWSSLHRLLSSPIQGYSGSPDAEALPVMAMGVSDAMLLHGSAGIRSVRGTDAVSAPRPLILS